MLSLSATSWFILAIWIFFLIIGYAWDKIVFTASSAVIGLVLGLNMIASNGLIGLVFLLVSGYLLYSALWHEEKKKGG